MDASRVGIALEALAGTLVLVEADDLPGLAGLHTQVETLGEELDDAAPAAVREAVAAVASRIEQIILDEVDDPVVSLAGIGRVLGAVTAVLRDGRGVDSVDLGLDSVAAPPGAEEAAGSLEAKPLEGDPSLLAEFVAEATEHLEAADLHLLQLETDPGDAEAIDAVFRAFHTIKGVAGFLALDQISHVAHEAENLLDLARKGKLVLEGPAIDVSFQAVDALKRLIAAVQQALASSEPLPFDAEAPRLVGRLKAVTLAEPGDKLGELLVGAGLVPEEGVTEALAEQRQAVAEGHSEKPPRLGEQLVREGRVEASDVALALRTQKAAPAAKAGAMAGTKVAESVKVDAERLDRILDTIGELVIAQSMVAQSDELRHVDSAQLHSRLGQLDKITRELQELGTSLRMVPVRATFQKMARLVRDLAKKCGKPVEFVAVGEDTELDKNVVDQIGDPLIHMIRNAVDHGLETPEQRATSGKAATGRVTLRAFHKGGNIHIEVEDDGRGLDKEAILAKAVSRGLLRAGEVPSDREIFNLIFEPGFSTAKQITDVSGRGVGMDVVRRNIEHLRGQVEIRSEIGRGSVFSMRLPLTLAIIDGMVVRVGSHRYIVPTLSIITTVRPTPGALHTVIGQGEMLQVQGRLLPLHRLSDVYGVRDAEPDALNALAIVVEEDGRQAAFLADELLGQQQIVIKSLGELLRGIAGLAGGAVMPDGRVGLIVDVAGLLRLAEGEPAGRRSGELVAEAAG
ncbi:MAG: chemotaxis protein CheA [Fimbriimonadaceae bacterium]|nr:chemotaxis protein CheA [Fimbriimonadaceae bacterium]